MNSSPNSPGAGSPTEPTPPDTTSGAAPGASSTAEPWATLEIRLRSADATGDGDWSAAGERLEALAAMIADDDRALGVETHDMSTLGQQTLHPELVVYTRPDALEGLGELATRLAEELRLDLALTATVREDDDWRDTWKQFYAPIVFGGAEEEGSAGTLLLRPSWIDRRPGDPALELVLDPGRAFGTGQHETTRLCVDEMIALQREGLAPGTVLDLGCGSGILALAAARLFPGAATITAVDNDPEATETTRENADHNALTDRLEIRTGTARELDGRHDLILANIRPSVLIPIAHDLAGLLAPSGSAVLSGILGEEAEQVLAAYAGVGLHLHRRRDQNEWCSLLLRPGDPA
jgi:ribosomal protein L11 methyltransferase